MQNHSSLFVSIGLAILAACSYAYGMYQKRIADHSKNKLEEMRIDSLIQTAKCKIDKATPDQLADMGNALVAGQGSGRKDPADPKG